MKDKYSNLCDLFNRKPELGWGESTEFNIESVLHVKEAYEILEGAASMSIVFERRNYLVMCEKSGETPSPFNYWIKDQLTDEKTYRGYVFNKFKYIGGVFVLDVSVQELDDLAKIYLDFCKK